MIYWFLAWWASGFIIILRCMYLRDDGITVRDFIVALFAGTFGLMNLLILIECSKAHWLNKKLFKGDSK